MPTPQQLAAYGEGTVMRGDDDGCGVVFEVADSWEGELMVFADNERCSCLLGGLGQRARHLGSLSS